MWSRLLAVYAFSELSILAISSLQTELFSDATLRILEQFPGVALVIFTLYWVQKQMREDNRETRQWLEHMLEVQRASMKEIYERQDAFVQKLLQSIEGKQDRLTDIIKDVSQQLNLNTATVSEIAKVDGIVNELIARLEKK